MSTTMEPAVDPLELIPTLPAEPRTKRDVFYDAIDLLLDQGWTTGTAGMCGSGPFCILGAVAHAAGLQPYDGIGDYHGAAALVLNEDSRTTDPSRVWEFNDDQKDPQVIYRTLFRLADGATWDEAIA